MTIYGMCKLYFKIELYKTGKFIYKTVPNVHDSYLGQTQFIMEF